MEKFTISREFIHNTYNFTFLSQKLNKKPTVSCADLKRKRILKDVDVCILDATGSFIFRNNFNNHIGTDIMELLLLFPKNLIISGGSISQYLGSTSSPMPSVDVDIFIHSCTTEFGDKIVHDIYNWFIQKAQQNSITPECYLCHNALTLFRLNNREVQIILKIYESPEDVIYSHDLSASQMYYSIDDGIRMSPIAASSIVLSSIIVDSSRQGPGFLSRLRKYHRNKNYGLILNLKDYQYMYIDFLDTSINIISDMNSSWYGDSSGYILPFLVAENFGCVYRKIHNVEQITSKDSLFERIDEHISHFYNALKYHALRYHISNNGYSMDMGRDFLKVLLPDKNIYEKVIREFINNRDVEAAIKIINDYFMMKKQKYQEWVVSHHYLTWSNKKIHSNTIMPPSEFWGENHNLITVGINSELWDVLERIRITIQRQHGVGIDKYVWDIVLKEILEYEYQKSLRAIEASYL